MVRTFLITGGTGMVGREITRLLQAEGHHVRHLSTQKQPVPNRYYWNPAKGIMDAEALKGVDTVIHLAGANVADRWTPAHKAAILSSRIEGGNTLHSALAQMSTEGRPKHFISASAVGIYPNHPDHCYSESDGQVQGFLGEVVQLWEAAADRMEALGIRVAKVRIGIVLGKKSGVLGTLVPLFSLGLGSPLGNGKHWMPWIHVTDLARQFIWLSKHPEAVGVWNGVGPASIQNRAFSKALASALRRPFFLPAVPGWFLYLMLGPMAQVALMSTRSSAEKWAHTDFQYTYATLEKALEHLVSK
jgi:uncharacterized protein